MQYVRSSCGRFTNKSKLPSRRNEDECSLIVLQGLKHCQAKREGKTEQNSAGNSLSFWTCCARCENIKCQGEKHGTSVHAYVQMWQSNESEGSPLWFQWKTNQKMQIKRINCSQLLLPMNSKCKPQKYRDSSQLNKWTWKNYLKPMNESHYSWNNQKTRKGWKDRVATNNTTRLYNVKT